MSKELEALERIKYKLSSTKVNGYWEGLDIIETELKNKDKLETKNTELKVRNKKLEKAIKIIQNKLIDYGRLYGCMVAYPYEKTPIHYNEKIDKRYKTYMLTQEDFGLFKEL